MYPSRGAAWVMVLVLMVAYVFSFIDRQIMNLLVQPIRHDMGLTDLQMSYLIGPSFALFYAVMGLPLGRLVDRRSRTGVAAGGVATWSVMTVLCGMAGSFGTLFFARAGVAVGEAALAPAAQCLIVDSFPPEQRARPLSVFALGIWIGTGLAFLVGGAVIHWAGTVGQLGGSLAGFAGWQIVFFAVGVPGLLVSAALVTIRGPARPAQAGQAPGVAATVRYLRSNAWLILVCVVGFAMIATSGYCLLAWAPTTIVRRFGWSIPQVGSVLGVVTLCAGLAGTLAGGWLGDYTAMSGIVDGKYRITASFATVGAAAMAVSGFVPGPLGYVACYAIAAMAVAVGLGIGPAALQEIAPDAFRGQLAAIYVLIPAIIGLGLGPPAVAFLSEKVFASPDIGLALAAVTAASFLVAALLLVAGLASFRSHTRAVVYGAASATPLPHAPDEPARSAWTDDRARRSRNTDATP